MEELKDFAKGPRKRNFIERKMKGSDKVEKKIEPADVSEKEVKVRTICSEEEDSEPQQLTSHLLSLSSGNVSSELRKSCSNIISLSTSKRNSSEKEILLKRLKELIDLEVKSIKSEIETKKKQMKSLRSHHKQEIDKLLEKHQVEQNALSVKHNNEMETHEEYFKKKIRKVKNDLDYLETELHHLSGPVHMLSSLLPPSSTTSTTSMLISSRSSSVLEDMSDELSCCGCNVICLPPAQIYQCPQGKLIGLRYQGPGQGQGRAVSYFN